MERLSDIRTIKNILTKHGFTFSKALGQNFLINPSVCPRMAEKCGANPESGIIEIGPGIGVLTTELAKRSKKVVAIELDTRLLPVLSETLSEHNNVTVINNDVMKVDINGLIAEQFGGMNVSICANLPYYITSPILMMLLESKLPVDYITVMVQKEAAQRLSAKPGSRDVGAISIAVQYYCEPEILFSVSKGSFMPSPNVDSAVIRLKVRQNLALEKNHEKNFFRVVRSAFQQRRKTILNAVSAGTGKSKAQIQQALELSDIPLTARIEQLSMEEMMTLSKNIYD